MTRQREGQKGGEARKKKDQTESGLGLHKVGDHAYLGSYKTRDQTILGPDRVEKT
jgi:hypothetical protein